MDKSKTKIYKSYDSNILQALFLKYGLSKYYIRQSINGSVKGVIPDNIKKDYVIMEKANKETVSYLLQKTLK
ncbi:hypothetical protein ASF10_19700 [Flavobacterium sp. Leaf82]|uniref:hypothetical protein n=1 Tax=unclassified Flavobacterium TaxID=196869 RepID=UPI0006F86D7B|nr:hypothetical protein [Flavobacterium sp. Leaf82]KQO33026.1 hypothetical protein ASF10_19700 [Flavobacterium sp. Leaf82]